MLRQIVKVVRNCARTKYHKTGLALTPLLGLAADFVHHKIQTPPAFIWRVVFDFFIYIFALLIFAKNKNTIANMAVMANGAAADR